MQTIVICTQKGDSFTPRYTRLTSEWIKKLASFFNVLEKNNDIQFFHPHSITEEKLRVLNKQIKDDQYYLLINGEKKILGYGLLRGWDEGYDTPSLGIAIHPSARGQGLGEGFMHFLHELAQKRGAKRVRLRVQGENITAIKLYKKLDYIFEDTKDQDGYLLGFKSLI